MLNSTAIAELFAYQIYDSRGQPTVEAELSLKNGKIENRNTS